MTYLVHHLVGEVDGSVVGDEGAGEAGGGARDGEEGEHVLHGQHVLVAEREGGEGGEEGARGHADEAGEDGERLGGEGGEVVVGGAAGARQPRLHLVLQLVEVARVQLAVVGPLARAQRARLPLDQLEWRKMLFRQSNTFF